jgi:hypothetical protein
MLIERKMPDASPMVELEIHYKVSVDLDQKISYLRDKYGFQVAGHEKNEVYACGDIRHRYNSGNFSGPTS